MAKEVNSGLQTIGKRLLAVRKLVKMKQIEFATQLGISQSTYARYEQNRVLPDADLLASICTKWSINPAWLLLAEGPMQGEPEPPTLPNRVPDESFYKISDIVHKILDEQIPYMHRGPLRKYLHKAANIVVFLHQFYIKTGCFPDESAVKMVIDLAMKDPVQ